MREIINDLRGLADNPDVYGHKYPELIRMVADRLEAAASDCLKPVPVGEPCRAESRSPGELVAAREKLLVIVSIGQERGEVYCQDLLSGHSVDIYVYTPVQPVRLVPALEALEKKS